MARPLPANHKIQCLSYERLYDLIFIKAESAFYSYGVGKLSSSCFKKLACGGLVPSPRESQTCNHLTQQKPKIHNGSMGTRLVKDLAKQEEIREN